MTETTTNSTQRRVLMTDTDNVLRVGLQRLLESQGIRAEFHVCSADRLVQTARRIAPGVVLVGAAPESHAEMAAANALNRERLAPVVLLTTASTPAMIRSARQAGVYACLVKPVQIPALYAAMEMAIARWEQIRSMEERAADLAHQIQARKAVERAKGILMDRYGLHEREAIHRLEALCDRTGRPLGSVAEAIILGTRFHAAEEMFAAVS